MAFARSITGAGLCLLLAGCTAPMPENRLLGDWVVDLPTTPRAHGNLVGFRTACVFVRGNRTETRTARPVHYQIGTTSALVWYGAPAQAEPRNPAQAARVTFLTPDRIHITWPEGFDERYMRGIGDPRSNRECR